MLGQEILRRHLKGVDAYFRMFFSEGQPPAVRGRAVSKRAPLKTAERSIRR